MLSIIYKLTHVPSSKIYIGALKNKSKFETYNSSSDTVSRFIKTDPENWKKEILLEFSDISFQEVVLIEQSMIKSAVENFGWEGVFNKAYSLGFSRIYSPEALIKKIEKLNSEDVKLKISKSVKRYYKDKPNPMQGKKHSEETIRKLIDSHMGLVGNMNGKHQSEKAKLLLRQANLGKKMSEEVKLKISISNKGNEKCRYWKGKTFSDETRAKMSESIKKNWEKRKCASQE